MSKRYEVQMLDKGTGEWSCLTGFDDFDKACEHLEEMSRRVHSYDVPGWRIQPVEWRGGQDEPATVLNRDGYVYFDGSLQECMEYCLKSHMRLEIWMNDWFSLNALA